MALIVEKFGGSSVADRERVMNVAKIVTDTYKDGNDVVVVVSAQGDTTDDLIEKANEINSKASRRELDMLLSSGEQISVALLSMAIESMGFPVISLLGWQAGFYTNSIYGDSRIKKIKTDRICRELDKNNIVVVAGFQGINKYGDITTLGRGGSDTSAVALASALNADKCKIFTDVEGVFTADPRLVKNSKKLDAISYDEMLELASLGAQVLHNRSVEIAKKYSLELEVLSSLSRTPGTVVKENVKMEKMLISGVAKDDNVARISVIGVPDKPGLAFKMFSKLATKNINVDIILQSIGRNNTKDISFTVTKDKVDEAVDYLKSHIDVYGAKNVIYDEGISKISIVGAGMETHPGIAAKMFEALFDKNINIQMISTSEIKISVLIDSKDADTAIRSIHSKFFEDR